MQTNPIPPRVGVGVPSAPASVHLDALRGVAAVLVLTQHWRALFFQDFAELTHPSPIFQALYFLTSVGHQAVVVFFVLSGYLVGGSVVRQMRTDRWSWKKYLFTRLTRLYTVLIPALLLGWLWDSSGVRLFGTQTVYGGHGSQMVARFVTPDRLNLKVLAGNYLFLQNILTPAFGSNGPLWSLANEFWYYLAFPFAMLAASRKLKPWTRLASAAVAAGILWFTGLQIALYFLVWLMGVALAWIPGIPLTPAARWIARAVALAAVFGGMILPRYVANLTAASLVLGAGVWMLLYVVLHYSQSVPEWYARVARPLARFSYTLYVLHLPVLMFLAAALVGERWQPWGWPLLAGFGLLGGVLAYAQLVYWCFEARTDAIRERLAGALGMQR